MLTFKNFVLVSKIKAKRLAFEGKPLYKEVYEAAKAAAIEKVSELLGEDLSEDGVQFEEIILNIFRSFTHKPPTTFMVGIVRLELKQLSAEAVTFLAPPLKEEAETLIRSAAFAGACLAAALATDYYLTEIFPDLDL